MTFPPAWTAGLCTGLLGACLPAAEPFDAVLHAPEAAATRQDAGQAAAQGATPQPKAAHDMFDFEGELTQGGWIRGKLPPGNWAASLGNEPLTVECDGSFFAAFDRDSPPTLAFKAADGSTHVTRSLAIAPRAWKLEHIDADKRPGGVTSEAFWKIREPELARIDAARARNAPSDGWRQRFIWPVKGRISGRFGAQRIYRGEPGSYHTGLDIAPGAGVPFVSPADGVVTLAAKEPLSLEGHLVIIDHGQGLNSAFLHAASIDVEEGQAVRQGQRLGTVGRSGRASGAHLHWSLKWRSARLDPQLFVGQMY